MTDFYMNNYDIFTVDTINGVTCDLFVQNLTSNDVAVKTLTVYGTSEYNTAYTASPGVDPSKG